MRNHLARAVAVVTALTAPVAAHAHAGSHHGLDATTAFAHIFSSPIHWATLLIAALIVGWVFARPMASAFIKTRRRRM
ncbi:hypothetical protein [Hoeflea sp.]|uniref:hypothetical protein n=1 Tax=Hoeflea sp. TaxID=1940281 RepID=UPI003B0230D0